jgi:HK97 family phage major capsid protein
MPKRTNGRKLKMATDFPKQGDDKKISLRNSEYPQFDHDFAQNLKDNNPEIWKAGGNIRGNEAFNLWSKAKDGEETDGVLSWIKEREAWAARHFEDGKQLEGKPGRPSNIAGVVAQMKWGVIGTLGQQGMKDAILTAIKYLEDKEDRQVSDTEEKGIRNKLEEHNEKYGEDPKRKGTYRMFKAVFERGLGAYKTNPQSVRPGVQSASQWAFARLNSFIYALKNLKYQSKNKHDTDLLPSAHPLSSKENSDRIANMDTEARHIKDIRETDDSYIVEFGKSMPEPEEVQENGYMDEEKEKSHHEEEMERDNPVEEDNRANEESLDMANLYGEESLQRSFEFDRNKIDEESRTIEIGVSSEEPVMRNFGYEVLGHREEEIDMSFMAQGRSPLLLDHDSTKQIGVVERFGIDKDNKRTVAKVRFSKSRMAQEVFEDVKDGIRQNISVGYQVNKMEKEGEREGIPVYRVQGWTPLEVSAVSIPADQSRLVGFGRSKDVQVKSNKPEEITMENTENKTPEVNPNEIREQLAKDNAAILDLAAKHNKRDLGHEAVSAGISLEQFRGQLLETLANKPLDLPSNVEMNETEQRDYSLLKAVREAASGTLSGLEKEVSDEIASRTGKSARGFYMPTNINFGKRDQTVGTNSQGGFLKPTDHLADQFIEALYARLRIGEAGAQVLNGLVGDVAIPKLATATSNSAFVAEGSAPSEGAAVFSQVTMSPKTLAAYVDVSRKLMMQSDPSVEAVLRNDIINTFARKIDEVAIEGGGSNEPSGIIASSTGNVVAIGTNGGAISYSKVVDMVEAVEVDNAIINDESTCFLGNPKVTANLRTIGKQASGVEGNFILGEDNKILGYDYKSSTLVPSDLSKGTGSNLSALIFGDFSQLLLGFYSGVDVVVDQSSLSTSGGTRLAFFQDLDVALRHDDAFSVCKDITT